MDIAGVGTPIAKVIADVTILMELLKIFVTTVACMIMVVKDNLQLRISSVRQSNTKKTSQSNIISHKINIVIKVDLISFKFLYNHT